MEQLAVLPFVLVVLGYAVAVAVCRQRGRSWPLRRLVWMTLGALLCLAAVIGPLAELSDRSFGAHMVVHLLLGMAGPLLLVRSAPVTLALRALPQTQARQLGRALRSRGVRFLGHPVTAGLASVGALLLLYLTGLYALTTRHLGLHLLVHAHFLGFGYLFAASIVGVDADPHRRSFGYRSVVLVLFSAAHAILAKRIYAVPPPGVDRGQAQLGAQVLYYGSDALDLVLMILLCHRWYAAAGRQQRHGLDVTPAAPSAAR